MTSPEEHYRNVRAYAFSIIVLIILTMCSILLAVKWLKNELAAQPGPTDITYPLSTKVGQGVDYRRLQRAGFTFSCGQSVRSTDHFPAIHVVADITLTNAWAANEKRFLDTYAGIDQTEPNRGVYQVSPGDIRAAVWSIIGQYQVALCNKVTNSTVSGILSGSLTAELTGMLQEKVGRSIDSPFDIRIQWVQAVLPPEAIYSLAKKGAAAQRIKNQDIWNEMQMVPTAPPCQSTPAPRCS